LSPAVPGVADCPRFGASKAQATTNVESRHKPLDAKRVGGQAL
jgi:hypothetical protein